ncbi:MAG: putative Fur family transcriptional regulator [Desertimonas sp.]|nr:putative Fur family transcriptional regulator [Desertimonas sp.]
MAGDPNGDNGTDREQLHAAAERRLTRVGQRHTKQRRAILELIAAAARPVSVPELLGEDGSGVSQSSLYRNLVVLEGVGVLQRVTGAGHHDRFELSEALSGQHHHHLTCTACGLVVDIPADPDVEAAVALEASRIAAQLSAFVTGHSLDLYGRCADCSR